jgi:hypothetical protein
MIDSISKQSYFDVLTEIANFFNCNLLTRVQASTGNEYYTLTASNRKSLQIVLDYFERFPLYSSKYLDYKNWAEAAILILTNKHYSSDEIAVKIINLKNSMNLKRTVFNWDHLKELHFTTKTIKNNQDFLLNNRMSFIPSNYQRGGLLQRIVENKLKIIETVKSYSTISGSALNNNYIAGFCDAESTFSISVLKNLKLKTG